MTAKEYLRQYRAIASKLRAIDVMIADIRKELSNIGMVSIRSPWPDGQPHGSGTTDPTGSLAAKAADLGTEERREALKSQLLDLEIRELRARSELWKKRIEIEETLGEVLDPIYHDVLHRRYIEGQSFELIAVELNYSYRHVIRLHGEALLEVDKLQKK